MRRRDQPVIFTNFSCESEVRSRWVAQTDDRSNLKSCREPANVVATPAGLKLETLKAVKCHAQFSNGSLWSALRTSIIPVIALQE
jgi:hypothetical protein